MPSDPASIEIPDEPAAEPGAAASLDLAQDLSAEHDDRYHRLKLIRWWDQARLKQARVMVVGAGALGNEILKHLALLGIGHVLVCDLDEIEPSNLSRTVLFRPGDEGQSKSRLAAERVMELNPDVEAAWLHGDVQTDLGLGVFRRMDVVLGGVDNIEARIAVNRACWRAGTPYVDGGTHAFEGQVRVFAAPHGPCYECVLTAEQYRTMRERIRCNLLVDMDPALTEGKVATTPIASSIIAALQVQQAVGILHGMEPLRGKTIVFNGPTNETYVATYEARDTEDHAHSQMPRPLEVMEVPEASASMTAGALLALMRARTGRDITLHLGRNLVPSLHCARCDRTEDVLLPMERLRASHLVCPACGEGRSHDLLHTLDAESPLLDRRLSDLGVPPLDILFAYDGEDGFHLELTGDVPAGAGWSGMMTPPTWRAGGAG